GLFAYLSVARHRAFWTGRFDLGNMVQAVWSTLQGRPLETTDMAGRQFVRLGAHVDPVLVLFAPLYAAWSSPESLLVAQAVIVASGALPAFWLGRRWLGDDRLALAAAAVYLLYPPLQWAVVTEFHPVALAAPLLMYCVWAAEERRYVLLTVLAGLTALTKEQVGLTLAALGVWMVVRGPGRRYGAALAVLSLAWVAVAMMVIIPRFNAGQGSAFVGRYGYLGDDGASVLAALVTRPWDALAFAADMDRLGYVAALALPLALLPFAAPLLAAVALPELAINVLADWPPQYSVEYHYSAVIAPLLVAASILGLARLRRLRRPASLARLMGTPSALAACWIAVVLIAGVRLGPLPWWSAVPLGSDVRADQYRPNPRADALARAVAMVPDGVPVSVGNLLGARLSERERVLSFPVLGEARWVVVDRRWPYVGDRLGPEIHRARVRALLARPDARVLFDEDGILVVRLGAGA
ncbi:MAG: DUF2079 domain-containing protein, partial [Thermoleophilia bacterium]|nr:DUF2079 domain-containing protein [Thermoleophilia bacterium]